jgi:hypothetical protein
MANFGSNFITISKTWTTLKSTMSSKGLSLQYDETSEIYELFVIDGSIAYTATIYRGTVPDGVLPSYSQGQNDADKSDFETSYKSNANQPIGSPLPLVVDGYLTTGDTVNTALMASAYTEQSSNAQRSVVSSDATDSSAGTGARTIELVYLDSNMNGPFTEIITLNGTTPVNTVSSTICFIEKMRVLTAGSNGGNAGTISLKSTTAGGGSTVATIVVGDNETNWCQHYVPLGKTLRLVQVISSVEGAFNGQIRIRKFTPTVANSVDYTIAPAILIQPGVQSSFIFQVALSVPGPSRLILYAKSSGTGTMNWTAGFGYYES